MLLVVVPFAVKSVVALQRCSGCSVCVELRFCGVVQFFYGLIPETKIRFQSSFFSYRDSRYGGHCCVGIFWSILALSGIKITVWIYCLQTLWVCFSTCSCIFCILLNKWFFAQNFYAELRFNKKMQDDRVYNADLSFLDRFGCSGRIDSSGNKAYSQT